MSLYYDVYQHYYRSITMHITDERQCYLSDIYGSIKDHYHTSKSDAFRIMVTSGMLLFLLFCYLTLANERFSETPSHMEYWVLEQLSE